MAENLDLGDFGSDDDLDKGGGGYETVKPGQYHCMVDDVDDTRQNIKAIKVFFRVLQGTVQSEIGKRQEIPFWDPNGEDEKKDKETKQKLAKLARATDLIGPAALGTQVTIDWNDMRGRQVLVVFEEFTNKKGKTNVVVADYGRAVYHPRDPSMGHIPKDAANFAGVPEFNGVRKQGAEAGNANVPAGTPTNAAQPSTNGKPVAPPAAKPKPAPAAPKPAGVDDL